MAIQKLTDNVYIDFEEKRIYVDFDNASDTDNKIAVMNRADGFVILSTDAMPKPKRVKSKKRIENGKKNAHTADYWKGKLPSAAQKKKFEELCSGKGKDKGYFAAVRYAKAELTKKQDGTEK